MKEMNKMIKLALAGMLAFALVLTAAGCLQAPAEDRAISNFLGLAYPVGSPSGSTTRRNTEKPITESIDETTGEEEETNETPEETIETEKDNAQVTRPVRPLESRMTFELEGMEETIYVILHQSALNYSMYLDADRYQVLQADSQFLELGSVEQFWPLAILDELPDMYLQVGHLDDVDIQAGAARAQEQLAETYSDVRAAEPALFGEEQVEALVFSAFDGRDWDSPVVTVTVVDDGQNGVYVISNIYFTAAAEGHASRFSQMLETFMIG